MWTEEFSGTLLGFDDYVSKYPFIIRPIVCFNILIVRSRHGPGGCHRIVSATSIPHLPGSIVTVRQPGS
jgi:hypothetical protein